MANFLLGVNYWASNAGTYMWRNYDKFVVQESFSVHKKQGASEI